MQAQPGKSEEPLVDVSHYDSTILAEYAKNDMLPYTGQKIIVRENLAQRLALANADLAPMGYCLKVVYGYRHPAVQLDYFTKRQNILRAEFPHLNETDLVELTHSFVAMPEVAGHPTGGAIDVTLACSAGYELDMGTKIADFTQPDTIKTYADGLTSLQQANRQLLHDVLVAQGFAPFYGEWWHFSFKDREWAAFYGHKQAVYGPIEFSLFQD